MRTFSFLKLGWVIPSLMVQFAFSQIGSWQAHTSMRQVNDVADTGTVIWTATQGGIFGYTIATGEINRVTTVEGLHTINPNALAFDNRQNVLWIGYEDGALDRYDLTNKSVRTFRDIARATQFTNRSIGRIKMQGDSVLVATAFGLVVFDAKKNEIRDSYTQFGNLTAGLRVYDMLIHTTPSGQKGIWVALERGVAYAPLSGTNLREPAQWTLDQRIQNVNTLGHLGQTLFIGTKLDGYHLGQAGWEKQGFIAGEVRRMVSANDRLVVTTPFWHVVLRPDGQRALIRYSGYLDLTVGIPTKDGSLWSGDRVSGLAQFTNFPSSGSFEEKPTRSIVPNGPFWQLFADLESDGNGNLYATAFADLKGTLYHLKSNTTWENYPNATVTDLKNKTSFDRVHVDTKDNVWVASSRIGAGLLQIQKDGQTTLYNDTNSSLRAIPNFPGDIRIGGMDSEQDGTLWMSNFLSTPRLHIRSTSGQWTGLNTFFDQNGQRIEGDFTRVFVDSFGKKWIVLFYEGGVMVMDTKNTPTNTADDKIRYWSGKRSDGKGLPSAQVRAICEDRKGGIWIGTNRGLTVFVFGNLATDSDPNWPARDGAYVLREVFVNDMAVDAANRLWIATTEGVWVMNAETYEVLNQYTKDNSPLFTNNVSALAIDDSTGRIYFATDLGLVSFQSDAARPQPELSSLRVSPVVAKAEGGVLPNIYIKNLTNENEIRILNAAGTLITRFNGYGGQVLWNGRDDAGNLVPSGVYFVVALNQTSGERAVGKVAIVR